VNLFHIFRLLARLQQKIPRRPPILMPIRERAAQATGTHFREQGVA
jgi:hypothetical protein